MQEKARILNCALPATALPATAPPSHRPPSHRATVRRVRARGYTPLHSITFRTNCCKMRAINKPLLFRKAAERIEHAHGGTKQESGSPLAVLPKQHYGWMQVTAGALAAALLATAPLEAQARPEGVNRPELLPKGEVTTVIDVAGFLSEGQERRLRTDIKRLEDDTGFKLRILAQNYPNTPGLAVKDYWKVDDNTIVFVADPSLGGNILNFNVGAVVDLNVPRSFWGRLSGKYGNMFYWKEKGEDTAIEEAVIAIDACLREPPGPTACALVK